MPSGGGSGGDLLFGFVCGVISTLGVLLVCGIIIGVAIGLNRAGESMDNSDDDSDSTVTISTDFYSPGDSRLLSLSSFFCDGGSLELSSNSVDAELFFINDTSIPPLNDTNQFTVSIESTIASTEFRFWQYHLHPNSNISVSVCTDLLVDVHIGKGNDNANSWATNPIAKIWLRYSNMHLPVIMICRIHLPFHIESSKKMSTM